MSRLRAGWTRFTILTQDFLIGLTRPGEELLARHVAEAIDREVEASAITETARNEQADSNIAVYQEKLSQAARRIEKLERQVEVQKQRLGQYYQRFYPPSLAVAEEQLLALGAALGYKRLLKYNELMVEIAAGADAWREFATHADYDQLALAILQAQRFYDNLEAIRSGGKRDTAAEND